MISRWTRSHATLAAFTVLSTLVAALSVLAVLTGFGPGLMPNFMLNAACDMLGGLTILFLIEPIVRAAAGGMRAHPHFNHRKFCQRVARAQDAIRILDTSSRLIQEDATKDFRFRNAVRAAVDNGAEVRILLMSPASDISRSRAQQLRNRYPDLDLDRRITAAITQVRGYIAALDDDKRGLVELRLYTVPAPFIMHGADDILIHTTVPNDAVSDDAPHIEVRADTLLGAHLLEGFDSLWDSSRSAEGLIPVRDADRPDDVAMQLRAVEHDSHVYLASNRLDRRLELLDEPRFLVGEHDPTLYRADPVPIGTALHTELLLSLHKRYPQSFPRSDRRIYRMIKDPAQHDAARTESYRRLPARVLTELIRSSVRDIRIMDTSSTLLLTEGSALAASGAAFNAALDALRHGARLRVLLMAPGSAACRARAAEINRPDLEQEIRANLRWLAALARRSSENLELSPDAVAVRLYDRSPTSSVYQADDTVVIGFMPYGTRSSVTPYISAAVGHGVANFAIDQFQELWDAEGDQVRRLSPEELAKHLDQRDL
ncbi:hypothetical protein ABH935_006748 [Catenulispora sp. GAS73]|uniref:hypothetical protein n=1 Tax=Catenulispora sp. GAS73 TaxID=3156269 RepID=UPI0035147047